MHLNLLPVRFRIRLIIRSQVRSWARLWLACLVLVIGACGFEIWDVWGWQSDLRDVQEQSQPVRVVHSRTSQMREELERLTEETERIENLQPADRTLPLLGILGESVAKTGGEIQILRMSMRGVSGRTPTPARATRGQKPAIPTTNTAAMATVSLQGVAVSDESLSRFLNELRSYDVFHKVDLRASTRLNAAVEGGREFQLECGFP